MAVLIKFEKSSSYAPLRLSNIPIVLGRSSKAGFQLQDGMCSGQHISLQLSPEGHVVVTDLNSTNGTYINETLISTTANLYIGDTVRIGDTKFFLDDSSLTAKEKSALLPGSNNTSLTSSGPPLKKDEKSSPDILQRGDSDVDLEIDVPANTSHKLAMVKNKDSDEALFELGESSGNTDMIKLDKFQSARKKAATTRAKTTKHSKPVKKQKPPGFLSKIKSLFGKND